ncbi:MULTISPECIES: nitrite/sulfite reductase [unclassified Novosphingobium]|uniref:nitrite/sulfite reductase n=1 Tax=unclassified Novosphingobium TaxID=2644732 RepID=UPI0014950645|nr:MULTISPECIES: nitrite/sulfite reductase [unclassified Novosphingobium]MBB3356767.1 sulfite reductase (NADPH) hemoprotein beta-component [Novosphingobium sp. BK256]MBB3373168.1 sulfite reductase (NADPH) hemoprotein beta-component [Novosphingobium sp. BK280]MBB3377537.1 sulfite reductase (NADPH) hemoprotein beta-component [Novosphingobium sp. BK258]MBB3419052.1 sulfite reductase (NADPH) hemoprotein beta-component [Novosphingobium sp. BK267]MBB3450113.1 sulfite reductase (NADPH) hemoprotein be
MYQYDQHDQAMVDARVAEFRGQVARRLSGELTEDQFKPLRLKNGLYLQLHAYMLRVAVPYGTLNSAQMRVLGDIADKYDRGYGHFTTRQNIQYNWIKLADAPDILADLAKVQLHAIQTSGNCIRNTTADHFAGAAADEVADPRPYAELLRQWSTFHPEFDYLPRKFKVAIIASETDRAAMRLHDIGIQIVKNEAGEIGCKFFAGGGMGRTPMIAPCIAEFVPALQMISFLEAALRVYNRHGRRDNKYKARIKILVHEIGVAEYSRQVQEEFAHILTLGLEPPPAELERIKGMFADPGLESGLSDDLDRSDPDFALWVDQNVHTHKQAGYAIVTISLKPVGGIPGDATADQIRLMADLARDYSLDELRVSHAQNIVLPHVKKADLYRVWQALDAAGLATPNLDLITDIIACPGLDYCALANARSLPLAQKITDRFADIGRQRTLGELKLKISGCINACGHHHAGHIGILGVDRKGVENYQLLLGGAESADTSLGTITGPGFSEDGVVDAIEKVTDVYLARREGAERFLDTYRRIGMAPFKEAIYG